MGFFLCILILSLAGTSETQAPGPAGVGSKSQGKTHLSTTVALSHDVTEGSVSAMQLNVHNGLAKNFSPSPLKDIVNNSSMLINKDLKKLLKRNSGYNTTRDFHGKCDDKQRNSMQSA